MLGFNPNLGGVGGGGGGGGGGGNFPPIGFPFSLNNSETVKAVTLTFFSIQ